MISGVEHRRAARGQDRREVTGSPGPADGRGRIGRFSDGLESRPDKRQSRRVGRFSDGLEQHPEDELNRRVGRFSDGQELIRGASVKVGRFSEGLESAQRHVAVDCEQSLDR